MSDMVLRGVAAITGLALVLYFLISVASAVLVNRQGGHWMARTVGHLAHALVSVPARRCRSYRRVQNVMAWIFPAYIALLIGSWFLVVLVGFTLLIWSVHAEADVVRAAIASGSALSTLGFMTPATDQGRALAIVEGTIGLGIVVFFFTFIPGYQTLVQVREAKVAWFYARAGSDPSAATFLEVHCGNAGVAGLTDIWSDWEDWFRSLIEAHPIIPMSRFVPSVHDDQSWIVAASTVLDTASFVLATTRGQRRSPAWYCYETGVQALSLLAQNRLGKSVDEPAELTTRADFDELCEQIAAAGGDLPQDLDAGWEDFRGLRAKYASCVAKIAVDLNIDRHWRPNLLQ